MTHSCFPSKSAQAGRRVLGSQACAQAPGRASLPHPHPGVACQLRIDSQWPLPTDLMMGNTTFEFQLSQILFPPKEFCSSQQ